MTIKIRTYTLPIWTVKHRIDSGGKLARVVENIKHEYQI